MEGGGVFLPVEFHGVVERGDSRYPKLDHRAGLRLETGRSGKIDIHQQVSEHHIDPFRP